MVKLKAELEKIFGAAAVSDKEADLAAYASDKSFAKAMAPSFVVKAKNADQVEALVKLANEKYFPIIPVSSGAPHYKGDTVPSVPGAVRPVMRPSYHTKGPISSLLNIFH